MKVYITKYALTKGIEEMDTTGPEGDLAVRDAVLYHRVYRPPNWHWVRASAVARAEQMRLKKIASLRKQIAKLEKLRFEEKP